MKVLEYFNLKKESIKDVMDEVLARFCIKFLHNLNDDANIQEWKEKKDPLTKAISKGGTLAEVYISFAKYLTENIDEVIKGKKGGRDEMEFLIEAVRGVEDKDKREFSFFLLGNKDFLEKMQESLTIIMPIVFLEPYWDVENIKESIKEYLHKK